MNEQTPNTENSNSWIDAAKHGDLAALGQLLDKFRPLLRQHTRESLSPAIQARVDDSDIIQQACLSAQNAIEQFRGSSEPEFVAWLVRILDHNILHVVERERGAAKRAVDREAADSGPIHSAPARITTPSQRAIRGEQRIILESAIAQLPDDQQAAVRTKYLEQATLAETAQRLGKTEDAVSGLLQRGVSKLHQLLKQRDVQEP